jgi:hypothetical protein
MATQQYTIANGDRGDNSVFTVPGDEDGGENDVSFATAPNPDGQTKRWYIHMNNGFDVDIDATVQGTHARDADMSEAGEDGSAITVVSGDIDFVDGTTGHTYIELSINPAGTPTSGSLTITFQTRSW